MNTKYLTNSCSVIGFKIQYILRKQAEWDSVFVSEPLTEFFRILSNNNSSIG